MFACLRLNCPLKHELSILICKLVILSHGPAMHELFNQCETLQAFQSVGDNAAAISMRTGEVIQMSDGGGGGGGGGY